MRKLLWIPTIFFGLLSIAGISMVVKSPDFSGLIALLLLLTITFAMAKAAMKKKLPTKETGKGQSTQSDKSSVKPASSVIDTITTDSEGKPSSTSAPVNTSAKSMKHIAYRGKVKGTSYRQGALKRVYQLQENDDLIDYTLVRDTYQGKPSIKVMAADISKDKPAMHIGFIAACDVDNVLPLVDAAEVDCDIYGGPEYEGDSKYFGAEVTLYTR